MSVREHMKPWSLIWFGRVSARQLVRVRRTCLCVRVRESARFSNVIQTLCLVYAEQERERRRGGVAAVAAGV